MSNDLEFALLYDFRNPPQWKSDPADLYQKTLSNMKYAEDLGFDQIMLTEHHFIEDDYLPSLLPTAAAVAEKTNEIKIGTGLFLLPLYNPIRVAEDVAVVDIISEGRFYLGTGIGYKVEEFEAFNIPRSARAGRMEESLEIIRRLFNGERFSYQGEHFNFGEMELHPTPVQDHLPIWIGGFREPAIRRAARLGDGWLGTDEGLEHGAPFYDDELAKQGKDLEDGNIGSLCTMIVTRNPDKRWQEAFDHFKHQFQLYNKWYSEAGMDQAGTGQFDHLDREHYPEEVGEEQGIFILTPEQAAEKIQKTVEVGRAPTTLIYLLGHIPPGLPPEWNTETMELMANKVMPEFR